MRKEKKPWESQKGIRAQETQNARGHAQITRKSDIQDKVSMPQQSNKKQKAANQIRAAKENRNDIKSQTVDSDP